MPPYIFWAYARGAKILSRCEVLKKAISDRESLQAVSSTNEHGHENQLHQNRADVPATPVSYASAGVVGPLIITERTISTRKADVTPEISTVATSSAVTTAAALTVIESDVHAPSGAIISSHVDPPQPESVIDSSLSSKFLFCSNGTFAFLLAIPNSILTTWR